MDPFNLTPVGRWIATGGASSSDLSFIGAPEGGALTASSSFDTTLAGVLQTPPAAAPATDLTIKKPAKDNSNSPDAVDSRDNPASLKASNTSAQNPSDTPSDPTAAPAAAKSVATSTASSSAPPAPQKNDQKAAADPSQTVIVTPQVAMANALQPTAPVPAPPGGARTAPPVKGDTQTLASHLLSDNSSNAHATAPQKPNPPATPQTPTDNTDAPTATPPQAIQDGKSQAKNAAAAHVQANGNTPTSAAQASATDASATDASAAAAASPATDSALGTLLAAIAPSAAPEKNGAAPAADTTQAIPQVTFAPAHTDTSRAEIASAAQHSPAPDTPDTFDQVMLGLQGKFDARTGKADIRLDPPNLGALHVSVSLENGQLTAEFQSASTVVRDLLKGNLDKLKTALQNQGVAVDRLAVDAPPAAASGTGQQSSTSFGSATHDGRSAGQYQQDGRSGQRSPGGSGEGFARMFTQAQDAPLDLVA